MAEVLARPNPGPDDATGDLDDDRVDDRADGVDPTEAVPTARSTSGWSRRPVALVVLLFVVGTAVGALFAVSLPPWALEDEPQHVDYVHQLATSGRVPALDDDLAPPLVEAMFDDDRWAAYGQETPPGPTRDELGLGGRSYLGYHPPLPYAGLAVVDVMAGDDVHVELYALRGAMALAFGLACALTGVLAARVAGGLDHRTIRWTGPAQAAALGAGLALAAMPAAGDAAGRVNTDGLAMTTVLLVVLALVRWRRAPDLRSALLVGATLVLAAFTSETAVVVLVPLAAVLVEAQVRRTLRWREVAAIVAPPAVGLAAWSAALYVRTGTPVGAAAFVDVYGAPFAPVSVPGLVRELVSDALLPWGTWHLPTLVSVAVLATIAIGLVLAASSGRAWPAGIAATMAVVQVGILAAGALVRFSTVTGRLLLPALPVVLAVAAVGWTVRGRRTGLVVWLTVTVGMGVWFLLGDQLPRYGLGG